MRLVMAGVLGPIWKSILGGVYFRITCRGNKKGPAVMPGLKSYWELNFICFNSVPSFSQLCQMSVYLHEIVATFFDVGHDRF